MIFDKTISLRWADLDPNFHLRHSVYYDLGSQQRVELLDQFGLTLKVMQAQHFGPILFREECIFRREIHLQDKITLTAKLAKMRKDCSRWSIQHQFLNEQKEVLATINVDGAWMDTRLRKLANPTPQIVIDVFGTFPKTGDFEWIA